MKSRSYYVLAAIGFIVLAAVVDANRDVDVNVNVDVERDDSGAVVDDSNVDAFKLRVGDCFNDAGRFDGQDANKPSVPCSEPHDNEAYAVFDVSYDSFPTNGSMNQLAYDACMMRFESYVGKEYDRSPLMIATLQPTAESWGKGHREVVCAVFKLNRDQLVGSMAARGL